MSFSTSYDAVLNQINAIEPVIYGATRNYSDGAVTRLSPYISRGVISTKQVLDHVLKQGHPINKIEKFIQELAWRDYWQQVWIAKGAQIDRDLKREQVDVHNHEMPNALLHATTGIGAIDSSLEAFYQDGYLHNHMRMYIASLACNVGKSHWYIPAKWMYYHLLDGDWASNALSWQWVAGSNAGKKYYANQKNINKFFHTQQHGTYLDIPYNQFEGHDTPHELTATCVPALTTPMPDIQTVTVDTKLPSLIYNYYNLDPLWHASQPANRILLLEPSTFKKYPIAQKSIDFMLGLAKNIDDIQVYVGEFDDLVKVTGIQQVIFKEHPLNGHYRGIEESRDWMTSVSGYHPSFFAFWKKCKKELA
jgi:deoxyribodipyrimidine photo-lyase